jgi:hypothetical protein
MTWATISSPGVTTSSIFYGDSMNKISNLFAGNSNVDSVDINSTWQNRASKFLIVDTTDTTKQIAFDPSSMTSGKKATLSFPITNNFTYTFPSSSITLGPTVIGIQDIWIPAVAPWITTTSPATTVAKTETGTNKLNYQGLGFAGTSGTYRAEFIWTPPRNWDAGTIKVTFYWICTNASTNSVVWRASGVAFQDNTAIDAAQGTQGTVTDANNAANVVNISGQTGAITIAGSPVAGNPVQIRVERQAITGSDNLAFTALLLGIAIEYTINAGIA